VLFGNVPAASVKLTGDKDLVTGKVPRKYIKLNWVALLGSTVVKLFAREWTCIHTTDVKFVFKGGMSCY